jgi:surface antigen
MCARRPFGVHTTSDPQMGDLVVFDFGTWGHVAVIEYISNGYVHVLEQNGDIRSLTRWNVI